MNTNSSTGGKLSVNITKTERIVSVLAGTALAYLALTKKGAKIRMPMLVAGGILFFRGATGHSEIYEMSGKEKLMDTVRNINIRVKMLVNKPRSEVYSFWRQLSNLPLFMTHLQRVDVFNNNQSHWVAKVPGGLGTIEWDAEIVKEIENELLGWNSLPSAGISNAGKVEFSDAADGNGTEITVIITYRAPFGDIGEGIASLLNPITRRLIEKDVKGFKKFIETGEKV